ncbi:MAG: hypothetical protein ACTSRZ_14575 [Promethearchaeota archaeon]
MKIIDSFFQDYGIYFLFIMIIYFFYKLFLLFPKSNEQNTSYDYNSDSIYIDPQEKRLAFVMAASIFFLTILAIPQYLLLFIFVMILLSMIVSMHDGFKAYNKKNLIYNNFKLISYAISSCYYIINLYFGFYTDEINPVFIFLQSNSNLYLRFLIDLYTIFMTLKSMIEYKQSLYEIKNRNELFFLDEKFMFLLIILVFFYLPLYFPELPALFSASFLLGLNARYKNNLRKLPQKYTKINKIIFIYGFSMIILGIIHIFLIIIPK